MQAPGPSSFVSWSPDGFADHTVRQVVRVTADGPVTRIRLSNVYGSTPLRIAAASVGLSAGAASVRPESVRPLTSHGSGAIVVPAGGELVSDPVRLPVSAGEHLGVTMRFAESTGPATYHYAATATAYRAGGDRMDDVEGTSFTDTSRSWYYLAGVETVAPRDDRAVAAFGDSITDGLRSTPDADNRYPDELADILDRPVVNAGLSGNRLLTDSHCFGERGVARFDRDVLRGPGIDTVVVLEGINDIHATESGYDCLAPFDPVPASRLIDGHRELIAAAHVEGMRVVGATVLPYGGSADASPRGEDVRDALNAWIRESGAYDAVVDLDRVMADPADPDRLNPAYDSGDALHPNDLGYHAMAEAVAPAVR